MNLKELNQPVKLENIDFRVQSVNKGGYAVILAYKDARYDMNVLDDVVGAENWQKDYKIIDGRLYCGVAIKFNNEWVWKWDVGTESNTEKEKGQASDSFKRACFNWGIGRELYEFPIIQIKLNNDEFEEVEYNGKKIYRTTYNFKLKQWKWHIERNEENKIIRLACKDEKAVLRFDYKTK